jgi:hypothetical protein
MSFRHPSRNLRWSSALSLAALLALATPARANDFDQVWSCEIRPGKSLADVRRVSAAWLAAAKTMANGDRLQLYIRYPIVVQPSAERFDFVVRAPSLQAWGAFYDAYHADSPVAGVDAEFAEIANCSGSALWEIIPLESGAETHSDR